jgi:hypothetical protein
MYLGIDQQSGLVYEGIEGPVLPVVPRPTVTQGKLIMREEDWNDLPAGIAHSPMSWIFREDTFDPDPHAARKALRSRAYPAGTVPSHAGSLRRSVWTKRLCWRSDLQDPVRLQSLRLAPAGAATRHGAEACPRDKRGSVCVANYSKPRSSPVAVSWSPSSRFRRSASCRPSTWPRSPRNSNNRSRRRSSACSTPRSGRLRFRS